jgi:hypothetical protein
MVNSKKISRGAFKLCTLLAALAHQSCGVSEVDQANCYFADNGCEEPRDCIAEWCLSDPASVPGGDTYLYTSQAVACGENKCSIFTRCMLGDAAERANLYCIPIDGAIGSLGESLPVSGMAATWSCRTDAECGDDGYCAGFAVVKLVSVGRSDEPASGEIYHRCLGRCFPAFDDNDSPGKCAEGAIVDLDEK